MSYRTKKENQNDRLNHDKIYIIDIVLKIAENIKIILVLPTIFFIISAIYANFFSNLVYTSESKLMSSSGSGKISQAFGSKPSTKENKKHFLKKTKQEREQIN